MFLRFTLLALSLVLIGAGVTSGINTDLKNYERLQCNRTAWTEVWEPFLLTNGAAQTNRSNTELDAAYQAALKAVQAWKSKNLDSLHSVCDMQQFLECDENNRCVCGRGSVPYAFEQKEGSTICLAKLGSICDKADGKCVDGVECINNYCGGAEGFAEESRKAKIGEYSDSGAILSSSAAILLTIVTVMHFIQ